MNVDAMEAYYSLSSASSAVFRTDMSVPTHALNSDTMEGQHTTATALPVDKIVFSLHARNSMKVNLSFYPLVLTVSIFIFMIRPLVLTESIFIFDIFSFL